MLIIPAIDIYEGKVVRLKQGDFDRKTIYDDEPWSVAKKFSESGCSLIHVVDLEGAKHGGFRNFDVIRKIVSEDTIHIQAGGGIRTEDDVSRLFDAGVERVVVGSVAVKEPEKINRWIELFGYNRIVIAIDIKAGNVAHSGWMASKKIDPVKIMRQLGEMGASIFLCTDISKDGMLQGPNVPLYKEICQHFPDYEIIASGGVSSEEDLAELRTTGVSGVVVGKALYEGKIEL
jgi:phosphoribosylformimino-5-aminoimidazole carboxamide ribotide isomerase